MSKVGRIAAVSALALGAAAGCGGDEAEEVVVGEPTAAFMAQAAEQSEGESFRFETSMSMSGIPGAPTIDDVELMTGESDGTRTHMVMDFDELFGQIGEGEEMPPQLAGMDLSMEMIADPDALYLKSGLLAMASQMLGGEAEVLGQLDDQWGKVDLEAFTDLLPADVAKQLGAQGTDPTAMLDLLREVGDVEELGSETQNGVAVTGYAAEVSLEDLLEAQGMSVEDFTAMFGGGDAAEGMEAILEVTMPIEVWVDDEGYVRREVMTIGGSELVDAIEDADTPVSAEEAEAMESFVVEMDMRMNDYGDDITVDVPEDAVDVTDAFQSLLEMSSLGG